MCWLSKDDIIQPQKGDKKWITWPEKTCSCSNKRLNVHMCACIKYILCGNIHALQTFFEHLPYKATCKDTQSARLYVSCQTFQFLAHPNSWIPKSDTNVALITSLCLQPEAPREVFQLQTLWHQHPWTLEGLLKPPQSRGFLRDHLATICPEPAGKAPQGGNQLRSHRHPMSGLACRADGPSGGSTVGPTGPRAQVTSGVEGPGRQHIPPRTSALPMCLMPVSGLDNSSDTQALLAYVLEPSRQPEVVAALALCSCRWHLLPLPPRPTPSQNPRPCQTDREITRHQLPACPLVQAQGDTRPSAWPAHSDLHHWQHSLDLSLHGASAIHAGHSTWAAPGAPHGQPLPKGPAI